VKVFISWSGEPSCSIARSLYEWLPLVVQHVKPWMSDEEILSGTRWNDRVAVALNETDFGIVCVTRNNQHKPWLMFEAGALAKRLDTAHVVPICIDIGPAEITGPLEAFQGRCFDEDGIRRLVREISNAREEPLAGDQVNTLFAALWPKLKKTVDEARDQARAADMPRRPSQDMLEELVERVRRLERSQTQPIQRIVPGDVITTGTAARVARELADARRLQDLMNFGVDLGINFDVLSEDQRKVLALRVGAGLSAEETAEIIGSTPGAVRVAQHRALVRLRKELPKDGDPSDSSGNA